MDNEKVNLLIGATPRFRIGKEKVIDFSTNKPYDEKKRCHPAGDVLKTVTFIG